MQIFKKGLKQKWFANNTMQFRIGNSSDVKISINGKAYSLNRKGQVCRKILIWEKKRNQKNEYLNEYLLMIKDW